MKTLARYVAKQIFHDWNSFYFFVLRIIVDSTFEGNQIEMLSTE